jgi:hypothetical protein
MSDTMAFIKVCGMLVAMSSLLLVFGWFLMLYDPIEVAGPQPGDCIKYREARQQSFFSSSFECVEWKQ